MTATSPIHEAERVVIGGILVNPDLFNEVFPLLSAADFTSLAHQFLFDTISSLVDQDIPLDLLTLADELEKHKLLHKVGGYDYLNDLTAGIPRVAHLPVYAQMIAEQSQKRKLAATVQQIYKTVKDPLVPADEALVEAQNRLLDLDEHRTSDGFRTCAEITASVMTTHEQTRVSGRPPGLLTGMADFDRLITGMKSGQMIVLAGRPGMGKSAFANMIALGVAKGGGRVAYFNLEMQAENVINRLIATEATVSMSRLTGGTLDSYEWDEAKAASRLIEKLPLFVDSLTTLTLAGMRANLRRLKQKEGLDLVIIDYISLIRGSRYKDNKNNEVAEYSRDIKLLAMELEVPVVAISQMNREVEKRSNHRPNLADLRDSGAIEQDADVVFFIHRPDYFNRDKDNDQFENDASPASIAEIIVRKQRDGPTGTIQMLYRPYCLRFDAFAHDHV